MDAQIGRLGAVFRYVTVSRLPFRIREVPKREINFEDSILTAQIRGFGNRAANGRAGADLV